MSYVINVGRERPAEAIVATPKKDGTPMGSDHLKRYISVGQHLLANVCSVWGRRVIEGKDFVMEGNFKKPIQFNTNGYSGEIEFLKYGDPNGHSLTIRYLKNSRSLDVEYQDNVQKIRIDLEKGADGSAQISLDAGTNKYDDKKDKLFIQYLQVHPQNRDSVSKNQNPEIKGFTFYEITEDNINTRSIENKEASLDAGFMVKAVSNKPSDLRALLQIIGKREELEGIDLLSKDKQIYEGLLNFAISKPNDFTSLVNHHKKRLSDSFEKAKSFNALDLTKDGHIALIVNNAKNVIWSEIKGKGIKMIDEVSDNYLDAENYKKTISFIELVEKLN
jgi:hypothetical protein